MNDEETHALGERTIEGVAHGDADALDEIDGDRDNENVKLPLALGDGENTPVNDTLADGVSLRDGEPDGVN